LHHTVRQVKRNKDLGGETTEAKLGASTGISADLWASWLG